MPKLLFSTKDSLDPRTSLELSLSLPLSLSLVIKRSYLVGKLFKFRDLGAHALADS